jgi:hypothetical protein
MQHYKIQRKILGGWIDFKYTKNKGRTYYVEKYPSKKAAMLDISEFAKLFKLSKKFFRAVPLDQAEDETF